MIVAQVQLEGWRVALQQELWEAVPLDVLQDLIAAVQLDFRQNLIAAVQLDVLQGLIAAVTEVENAQVDWQLPDVTRAVVALLEGPVACYCCLLVPLQFLLLRHHLAWVGEGAE